MLQMLTYPWDMSYPTNLTSFNSAVKGPPASPCNDEITESTATRSEAGYEWDVKNGGYYQGDFNDLLDRSTTSTSNRGLAYQGETSTNGLQMHKWFDVGAEGLKNVGDFVSNSSRSSWLRGCTGLWWTTNTLGMTQTRGCSGSVLMTAIRYYDPTTNNLVILRCTDKVFGNLSYGNSHYHSENTQLWGYRLSSADRTTVVQKGYRLLGFRIHTRLWRESSGTTRDNLRFGIMALTPSFGTLSNSYSSTGKRVVCRVGNTLRYNESGPFQIETR